MQNTKESETLTVHSDGLEIAVEMIGSGPTILFGHGLSGNRKNTLEQFKPLYETHRIVAFDQRGHAESSPVTNAALFEPRRMSQDMGAVLDALDTRHAIIGGESMGAALAMLFASENPDRVDRLLLSAPAFGHEPNSERARMHGMADAIEAHGIDAFLKIASVRQREEWGASKIVIEKLAAMQRSHDPSSLALACRIVIDWKITPDLQRFASFDRPTCVVGWPDDALTPKKWRDSMPKFYPWHALSGYRRCSKSSSDPNRRVKSFAPSSTKKFRTLAEPMLACRASWLNGWMGGWVDGWKEAIPR